MRIEKIKHIEVNEDGTFQFDGGAVETQGKIVMSDELGGCSQEGCRCSEGHWISIIQPRTEDGIVEGLRVIFDDYFEMNEFLSKGEIIGTNND